MMSSECLRARRSLFFRQRSGAQFSLGLIIHLFPMRHKELTLRGKIRQRTAARAAFSLLTGKAKTVK